MFNFQLLMFTQMFLRAMPNSAQAGLVLRRGKVPEKTLRRLNTQFPFKGVYFLAVEGLTAY
jgi:hypothetical protein